MEPLLGPFLLFLRRKKQEEGEEGERKDEKRKFAPSLIIFWSATERDRHPTVPFWNSFCCLADQAPSVPAPHFLSHAKSHRLLHHCQPRPPNYVLLFRVPSARHSLVLLITPSNWVKYSSICSKINRYVPGVQNLYSTIDHSFFSFKTNYSVCLFF